VSEVQDVALYVWLVIEKPGRTSLCGCIKRAANERYSVVGTYCERCDCTCKLSYRVCYGKSTRHAHRVTSLSQSIHLTQTA
jgi:hypothetical protein